MKTVLIAGASGMVGRPLSAELRSQGHRVVELSTRHQDSDSVRYWSPEDQVVDLADIESLDAVINLAGAGIADERWSDERKAEIMSSRVDGTRLLVSAALRLASPPAVFICASAVGRYGDRGDEIVDENASRGDGFLAEVVSAWEQAADAAAQRGMRVVKIRTGVVLDRSGGALARMLPFFRKGIGGRVGDGSQYMSWISLPDVVRIYVDALNDSSMSGAYNATAPEPVTNAEFTSTLGRALSRPTFLPVPELAIRALYGEMGLETVLQGQRAVPRRLQARGFQWTHQELEPALRETLE